MLISTFSNVLYEQKETDFFLNYILVPYVTKLLLVVVCCAQLIWGFSEKCTSAGSNLGVQTSTHVIGLINNSIMFSFKEVSTDFWKCLCFLVFMSSGLIHLLMYCNVQLWLRWNFKRQYSKCWICLPFCIWKLFAFLHTQLTDFCCQVHNLSKT